MGIHRGQSSGSTPLDPGLPSRHFPQPRAPRQLWLHRTQHHASHTVGAQPLGAVTATILPSHGPGWGAVCPRSHGSQRGGGGGRRWPIWAPCSSLAVIPESQPPASAQPGNGDKCTETPERLARGPVRESSPRRVLGLRWAHAQGLREVAAPKGRGRLSSVCRTLTVVRVLGVISNKGPPSRWHVMHLW